MPTNPDPHTPLERGPAFEAIFRKHDAIMMLLDGESGQIIDANDAALRFYGYSGRQITSLNIRDINALPLDTLDEERRKAVSGEQKYFIRSHRLASWEIRTVEVHTSPIVLSGKKYLFSVNHDITERKKNEDFLRLQSEILQNISEGVLLTRVSDATIVFANPRFETMFGYPKGELIGKNVKVLNATDDNHPEAAGAEIQNCLKQTGVWQGEVHNIRKDGTTFWCRARVSTFDHPEYGKVWVAAHEDITGRKLAEETLRESESNYRNLMEQASDAIFISDKEGNYTDVNVRACAMFGYTREEILRLGMKDLLCPEEIAATPIRFLELQSGKTVISERRMNRKDGSAIFTEISGKMLDSGRFQGIVRDISERKQAEEALRESEKRFQTLAEAAFEGIAITKDGAIFQANRQLADLLGYTVEELHGKPAIDLISPESRDLVRGIMSQETPNLFEHHLLRKNGASVQVEGTVRDFPMHGQRMRVIAVRDITERKRLAEELSKIQRLESLGILAGGIAHDFNNLMGGMFGYIDMANEQSKDGKVTHYLTKAMSSIDRARGLTRQLLTFAKGGAPVMKIDRLFPFVQETAQFALSGSNVSCRFDAAHDLRPCNFDKNQIGQVVDNIIINAQQAMPGGGTIEVAAGNISFGEKEHVTLPAGNYVKVSIKDSGIGIPKEIMPRIFDPFYTTKATGHGLGLTTCYSIVNRHGGCIEVESEPGKGSTFHVLLPASTESGSVTKEKAMAKHKGNGTFLVMDDEVAIRDILEDMLGSQGYTVVCKVNGKDAIDFVATELHAKRKIAGMIFDLTVPGGMGGKEAIKEVRKLCPETPVFVASGYADDPVMANPADHGFTASICKPFKKAELAKMLNRFVKKQA